MLPMLWQMHNPNKRWSLFYQTFEISLQLAILFIFLKLLTFSGTTSPHPQFLVFVTNSELLVLHFFLVSYILCVTGVSFVVFHSVGDIHIC